MKKKPRDQASPRGSWPEGPERAGNENGGRRPPGLFPLSKL